MQSYRLFHKNILPKLKTFKDLYKIRQRYNNKQIGNVFEIITKYVFLLHPQYTLQTQNIWLYDEVPYYILKNCNIPAKDKGIDLIWQDKDDNYYAIQCKFRMNTSIKVPWKDLATFAGLSFGVGEHFKGAIYVSNTYYINREILRSNKIISLFGEFFENLDNSFFQAIRDYTKNKKVKYKPKNPRPHQIKFRDNTLQHFRNKNRCYGILACGSGKTYASYLINKEMYNKITVICVPSLYLLSQFFKEWVNQSVADEYNCKYILIGSDTDADKEDGFINNGLLITTDKVEIYKTIIKFKNSGDDSNLVIITTYQSSDKLGLAFDVLNLKVDLCIFDEAHKTVGNKNNQFGLLLSRKVLDISRRLFMTATPKIYKKVGEVDENILSMNNEKWYGKEIFNYSTRQAINDGYLSEYQIVTLISDDDYVKKFMKDNKLVNVKELKNVTFCLTHFI